MQGEYRYRYYISFDSGVTWLRLRTINFPAITCNREAKKYYMRKSCEELKIIRYENKFVYDTLLALFLDISLITNELQIKVDSYTNFVDYDNTEYLGYLALSGIKVDEATGTISLQPLVKDDYIWMETHANTKILWNDIITDLVTKNTVKYEVTTIQRIIWVYWYASGEQNSIPCGFVECLSAPNVPVLPPAYSYGQHYKRLSIYDGTIPLDYNGFGDEQTWCKDIGQDGVWRVYVCKADHTGGITTRPSRDFAHFYWLEVGGNRVWRSYVQQQSKVPIPDYQPSNGEYDEGFPRITKINGTANNCPAGMYFRPYCTQQTIEWNYGNEFILLPDLFEYFLSTTRNGITASGLTLISQFLSDTANPVTGVNPNPYKYIQVVPTGFIMPSVGFNYGVVETVTIKNGGQGYHVNDICSIGQSGNYSCEVVVTSVDGNGAITGLNISAFGMWYITAGDLPTNTTGVGTGAIMNIYCYALKDLTTEYCFNDILNDACEAWDCFYYITDAGELVFEHQNFYENEFNYTGTPVADIDLTDETVYLPKYQVLKDMSGNITDNSYKLSSSTLPKFEKFTYAQGNLPSGMIEYDFTMAIASETEQHSVKIFTVDLELMGRDPDNHNASGLTVICCDSAGYVLKRQTVVEDILTADVLNGDLYWENLLHDLWIYYRYFKYGYINKGTTYYYDYYEKLIYEVRPISTFTQKKMREQSAVRFPNLEGFDPYKLIKTNLGNGAVKESKLSTDTGFINVVLLYP